MFSSPTPWHIEHKPSAKIKDAKGGTVANLTSLDLPNAELIVKCVNAFHKPPNVIGELNDK